MEVIDDGGVAKMKGYGPSSEHINKLDATAMAPDGYELPSMENFERVLNSTSGTIWLMWNGSIPRHGTEAQTSNVAKEEETMLP